MDFAKGEPLSSPSSVLLAELQQRAVPVQSDYADGYGRRFGHEEDHNNAAYLDPEKDLAFDATWKQIQRNTFTRWVNEHLKTANLSMTNLETDFGDGLLLIALVEVLSGKKLPKHTKKPNFRSQKLENVSVALTFLEQEEGIKLVSIDSADIVDSRLKLILGLVWALILHYALSKPKWEGDPDSDGQENRKFTAPKQRLMHWFHNKLPDLPVTNFTTDWNDGLACGALDNAVAPGLCPDWRDWDPKDALRNATEAMSLAEKWLGVAQLIRPEDMIDPNIDEQSMMTYLAQFPIAKPKPGAPLRTKSGDLAQSMSPTSPARARGHPERVQCGGRGIQKTGVRVGDVVVVKVATKDAADGNLTIGVIGPDDVREETDMQVLPDGAYECYYCPAKEGRFTVSIQYDGHHVAKSPYQVDVKPMISSGVRCYGPGLSSGAVGRPADFSVDVNEESGMLGFLIEGNSKVRIDCSDRGDLVARVQYWATAPGEYAVHVLLDNEDVPGSPFMADIVELPKDVHPQKVKVDMSNCKAVRVGEPLEVLVDVRDAGDKSALEFLILDQGFDLIVKKRALMPGVYAYSFVPEESVPHVVMVQFAGVSVEGSPFTIPLAPGLKSRSTSFAMNEPVPPRASPSSDYLPDSVDTSTIQLVGFEPKAYLNKMSEFTVDATGVADRPDGHLRITVTSPSGIANDALVSQKAPGLYSVSYSVLEEGPHSLAMVFDGSPVHGSPVTVTALRSGSSSSVGNASQIVRSTSHVSEETAGDGTTVITRRETRTIREVVSSTLLESMAESSAGSTVQDSVRGFELAHGDASKVVVSGSGLGKAYLKKPNMFSVKADAAGYNVLTVGIYGKILHGHEVKVVHVGQANYQVTYTLKERGEYLLHVKYGDDHIPSSPFLITCV